MGLTRKKSTVSKISIDVNFDKADKGYKDLLNPKLLKFLHISMTKGNTQQYLKAISVNKWELSPSWNEIFMWYR